MKLFSIPCMDYLARKLHFTPGACSFKAFSDGEWHVQIEEDVSAQSVWVLAATMSPADNLIQLLLLLDALTRAGARVSLVLTYFGYERQDRAAPGEALSAQVVANCFKQFTLQKILIVHHHSQALHNFIDFTGLVPVSLMASMAQSQHIDVIVAPDDGAHELAHQVAQRAGATAAYIIKKRSSQDDVRVVRIDGTVRDRRVLVVDDIISTGGTVMKAAVALREAGARSIAVMATHGLFSQSEADVIRQREGISNIAVLNTLPMKVDGGITTISIASWLAAAMQEHSSK